MRRYFRGKLDSNGALACKEEPLHSWVLGSNHELDGQQHPQVSLVPTAVYSNLIWLYQLSWKCKLATVTSYKADVSSVSPSSERMEGFVGCVGVYMEKVELRYWLEQLKAREIIRILTKRAWNYFLISLVTIWLPILTEWLWGWKVRVNGMRSECCFCDAWSDDCRSISCARWWPAW